MITNCAVRILFALLAHLLLTVSQLQRIPSSSCEAANVPPIRQPWPSIQSVLSESHEHDWADDDPEAAQGLLIQRFDTRRPQVEGIDEELTFNAVGRPSSPIFINVYLFKTPLRHLRLIGVGIYHCGIEVDGVEYSIWGTSGGKAITLAGKPRQASDQMTFLESLGPFWPSQSKEEVADIRRRASRQWDGHPYHMLLRNCNHYVADLLKAITGEILPERINKSADVAACFLSHLPIQSKAVSDLLDPNQPFPPASSTVKKESSDRKWSSSRSARPAV